MKKVNTKNFKKTLSKFSTGITVVCVKNNNSIYGKTVNSFNSLSLNPPMVLFSLGNYSSSIKQFSKTNFLSINILSSKQKKLSDNFASTRPKLENIKFPIDKLELFNCDFSKLDKDKFTPDICELAIPAPDKSKFSIKLQLVQSTSFAG